MSYTRWVLVFAAGFTVVAGCGGTVPQAGLPHVAQSRGAGAADSSSIDKLLYVASTEREVLVYDYETHAPVQRLHVEDPANGFCVDRIGDVWILEYGDVKSPVVEYPHGGTVPLRKLRSNGTPVGCAVDPTSGNLAVANLETKSGRSTLQIFRPSGERGIAYKINACSSMFSAAYDHNGNLYIEGSDPDDRSALCELPHGGNKLRPVTANVEFRSRLGVMWDGKHITLAARHLGGPLQTIIYQMAEDASGNLKKVGSTLLRDSGCGVTSTMQPFIVGKKNTPANTAQGNEVVAVNFGAHCGSNLEFWSYPAGGNFKSRVGVFHFFEPKVGAAVSIRG